MRRRRGPTQAVALALAAVLHLSLVLLILSRGGPAPPMPPDIVTIAALLSPAPAVESAPPSSVPAVTPPAPPAPPRLDMPVLPPIIQIPLAAPAHPLSPPAPSQAADTSPLSAAAPGPTPAAAASTGSADRMPLALADNPPPAYPELARRKGFEGVVVLRVSVSDSGEAMAVVLASSSGHDLLDERAIETVRRWRFEPARSGGRPVPGLVLVPIAFLLHA